MYYTRGNGLMGLTVFAMLWWRLRRTAASCDIQLEIVPKVVVFFTAVCFTAVCAYYSVISQ